MKRFTMLAAILALAGFFAVQGCERKTDVGATIKEGLNDTGRAVEDAVD